MYNIEYKDLLTIRHYNKITHYYEYNIVTMLHNKQYKPNIVPVLFNLFVSSKVYLLVYYIPTE